MSNTPSDAEVLALAQQHLKAFAQFSTGEMWFEGEVEFARAVLAKWGTPQPVVREPLTREQVREWWERDNGLEDCDLCELGDFMKVVRAVEEKHDITKGGQHGL